MTPNSTYKILGAKVIESSLSIILGGVFFTLLGALDITLITTKYGSFKDLIDLINMIFGDFVYISPATIISSICVLITFWLYFISVGFLAVVICATYLNGKKHNGILSFLLFLAINGVCQFVINHATALIPTAQIMTYATIGSYLALAAGIYFLNAWIMDNQLSV